MAKYWRVEHHVTKEGPYVRGATWRNKTGCYHSWCKCHPTPFQEGGPIQGGNKNHFHAFKSLDQLVQWFRPGERNRLHKLGYKVVLISATLVWRGEKQVVIKEKKYGDHRVIPLQGLR